jgi:DNA-binding response OmpR family regulator
MLQSMTPGHPERSAHARGSSRVLVVEDDPETRQFYIAALVAHGFVVDDAHNGFQAFAKILESAPDLVLTDIAVPGLDGIELCRRLRAEARTRRIPVLAVTGYGDRHYPDRAREAGANSVLTKPVELDVLVSEARRLLTEVAPAREPAAP